MHFFMNGSFKSQEEAYLPILDLGLLRGYAVFDYLRTYQGKPFHLREHLQRLQYSAMRTQLTLPYSFQEIEDILVELLKRGNYPESSIKIIVTGGVSLDQMLPQGPSTFIAFVYPMKPYPEEWFSLGIKAITTTHIRPIAECKTLCYLPAILSLQEGQKQGAIESLYLSKKKTLLEATTSNFFAFKKGVLLTPPPHEILIGITREIVLRLAHSHAPVEIREIPYEEIEQLDEAFLTASNKEIMPLVQVNEKKIGSGKVGVCTKEIQKLFREYTRSSSWDPLEIPRYTQK